jgi:hypothetical protein
MLPLHKSIGYHMPASPARYHVITGRCLSSYSLIPVFFGKIANFRAFSGELFMRMIPCDMNVPISRRAAPVAAYA